MKQQIIDIIETEVAEKLRLNKADVMWLKIEYGVEFLHNYLEAGDPLIEQLKQSKAFWNWWRAVWANRDKYLLKNTSEPRLLGYLYLQPVHDMTDEGWMKGRMIMWNDSSEFYQNFHQLNCKSGHIKPPHEVIELNRELIFNHK